MGRGRWVGGIGQRAVGGGEWTEYCGQWAVGYRWWAVGSCLTPHNCCTPLLRILTLTPQDPGPELDGVEIAAGEYSGRHHSAISCAREIAERAKKRGKATQPLVRDVVPKVIECIEVGGW